MHIDPLVAMSIGVLVGGALQVLWQVPSLLRAGFVFRPRVNWHDEGLRRIVRMMGPALLGAAAVQINVFVNTHFASKIRDESGQVINGPVSWLSYAFRFMQLPIGLFGVAIGSATLPAISTSAALGRMEEFGETLRRSLGAVLFLTIPASVGLAVLGESMIATVYQRGNFTAADTHRTALALAGYAVGLAGYAAIKVITPAFYAAGDARTPMLVSAGTVAVNLVAAATLVNATALGHTGLALSTSFTALFSAFALYALLPRRVPQVRGGALAGRVVRITAASCVMAAACFASSSAIHAWLGPSRRAAAADVAISIPLGAAVFCAAAFAMRVPETAMLSKAAARARAMLHF